MVMIMVVVKLMEVIEPGNGDGGDGWVMDRMPSDGRIPFFEEEVVA